MKTISATEAKNRLGAIIDAAQQQPIVIRRQERDVAVIISMRDFERLRALNIRQLEEARTIVATQAKRRGLTQKKLAALLADEE
jgi:prevent-host-death family protein